MSRSQLTSCRAIVLRRTFVGEADAYIELLTQPYGIVTALAKSARKSRKRYCGGLDVFCHNDVVLRGELHSRSYLSELTVLNSFIGLREILERTLTAGVLVQWVRRLCPEAAAIDGVYSLLGQCLALVEKESEPTRLKAIAMILKLRLLSRLGLAPRLDTCAHCATKVTAAYTFDIRAGGLICTNCPQPSPAPSVIKLTSDQVRSLQAAQRIRLIEIADSGLIVSTARDTSKLLTRFASYHTHSALPD